MSAREGFTNAVDGLARSKAAWNELARQTEPTEAQKVAQDIADGCENTGTVLRLLVSALFDTNTQEEQPLDRNHFTDFALRMLAEVGRRVGPALVGSDLFQSNAHAAAAKMVTSALGFAYTAISEVLAQ
jgi:hypothetical protein